MATATRAPRKPTNPTNSAAPIGAEQDTLPMNNAPSTPVITPVPTSDDTNPTPEVMSMGEAQPETVTEITGGDTEAPLEPIFTAGQTKQLKTLREKLELLDSEVEFQQEKVAIAEKDMSRTKEAKSHKIKADTYKREDAKLDKAKAARNALAIKIEGIEKDGVQKAKDALTKKQDAEAKKAAKASVGKALAPIEERYDIFVNRPLTQAETEERNAIESRARGNLSRSQEAMIAFAKDLTEIKDKKLYVDYPGGFAQYCQDVWNINRSTADRTLNFANVVKTIEGGVQALPTPIRDEAGNILEIKGSVLPKTESQTRELSRAGGPADMLKVWKEVVKDGEENGTITAASIRAQVDKYIAKRDGTDTGHAINAEPSKNGVGGAPTEADVQDAEPSAPAGGPVRLTHIREYGSYRGIEFAIEVQVDKPGFYAVFANGKAPAGQSAFTTHAQAMARIQELAGQMAPDELDDAGNEVEGDEDATELESVSDDDLFGDNGVSPSDIGSLE